LSSTDSVATGVGSGVGSTAGVDSGVCSVATGSGVGSTAGVDSGADATSLGSTSHDKELDRLLVKSSTGFKNISCGVALSSFKFGMLYLFKL
jgi:hypothetical protein